MFRFGLVRKEVFDIFNDFWNREEFRSYSDLIIFKKMRIIQDIIYLKL
jgi:hypothetical protein